MEYLEWLCEDEPARKALNFERMSKGWTIGSSGFKKELIKEHQEASVVLKHVAGGGPNNYERLSGRMSRRPCRLR